MKRAEHHGEGRLVVGRRASTDDSQVVEDNTKLPPFPHGRLVGPDNNVHRNMYMILCRRRCSLVHEMPQRPRQVKRLVDHIFVLDRMRDAMAQMQCMEQAVNTFWVEDV